MKTKGLHHRLEALCSGNGAGRAYTFLEDGEGAEISVTYQELYDRARQISEGIKDSKGQAVLLLLPPGIDYIAALLGSFMCGAIAVPAYPPLSRRMLPRILGIMRDCGARIALATADSIRRVRSDSGMCAAEIAWLAVEEMSGPVSGASLAAGGDSAVALLQYTSGSTGTPKGVVLTHGNIAANEEMIRRAFGHDESTVLMSWLPPYHDMGLIGGILQPLHLGTHAILMSPARFVERPSRWLRAIQKHRATTSGGPNFAYDLCVQKVPAAEREALDLSSWKVAFNGAEPVRHDTMEGFSRAFAGCGFRRASWFPCYGLAEATLIVAGGHWDGQPLGVDAEGLAGGRLAEPGPGRRTNLVASGRPVAGAKVVVVDPATRAPAEDGTIGEIWVAGESVAARFWTQKIPRGKLRGQGRGATEYLRTGDLGAMRDGQIVVTGRLKDLLIANGRKHSPADIEASVQNCNPGLRRNAGAAFMVPGTEGERVVIVQEVLPRAKGIPSGLESEIRKAVYEEFQLAVKEVCLVAAGAVPRTTSGKIQRGRCREMFLTGSFLREGSGGPAAAAPEGGEVERALIALWREDLDQPALDASSGFFGAGGDSLQAMRLLGRLRRQFGREVTLTELLENDSPRKMALLVSGMAVGRKSGESSSPEAVPGPIPRLATAEHYAASNAQQGLWGLSQRPGASPAYNLVAGYVLEGDFDAPAFKQAVARVEARHESLRTSFVVVAEELRQKVGPPSLLAVEEADWRERHHGEQAAEAEAGRDVAQAFDLALPPLARVRLIRIGDQRWILQITLHHLIADGWSAGVLAAELAKEYGDIRHGEKESRPIPPVQYRDYAAWRNQRLAVGEFDAARRYWLRQLGGNPLPLDLPADRPRPAAKSYRGGTWRFEISAPDLAAARQCAGALETTLFVVLTAAFKALLFRLSGQRDIVVGTPAVGRSHECLDQQIGLYVGMLALRDTVEAGMSFAALVSQVKRTVLEGLAHQDYPFDELVRQLRVPADASRHPIFDVMIVLEKIWAELSLPGANVRPFCVEQRTSKYDLTLQLTDVGEKLLVALEYDSDLFDENRMEFLGRMYQRTLREAAGDPARGIWAIELLGEGEKRQLREEFNATEVEYPADRCIHELFEREARLQPEAVAFSFGSDELTFAQLNARSNQLARRLRREGVGVDCPVGMLVERSLEMVVGILGILKAGGAYLPIDPGQPGERIEYILRDSGSRLVLTQGGRKAPAAYGGREIDLDDLGLQDGDAGDLLPLGGTRALAYVIYTSGSTGLPKGAMLEHGGVVNRLVWMARQYGIGREDVILQKTRYTFDVSVWELLLGPVSGAASHLLAPGMEKDPGEIVAAINRRGVTLIHFVPPMLGVFLESLEDGTAFSRLKHCVCSGEALGLGHKDLFFRKTDGRVRLHNLYGPTEASVDVTFYETKRDDTSIPIGKPVANTRIYVLDAALQPSPLGVAGELGVGGVQIARGYLGRPDLTAEKFVADPCGEGARLYRTGDLAQWRPDGNVEFLGRRDDQVKIRGHRVELGEVEAALRQHPGVGDATVLARAVNSSPERSLCAYYVARGERPEAGALREHLQRRLPGYMVPAYFVPLARLPLTLNGKVDRKRLPDPSPAQADYVAPQTAMETLIAGVCRDVLGAKQVGVHDNFFDLGADSLLLVRVQTQLQRLLGREVPGTELFQFPTIYRLARRLVGGDEPMARGPAAPAVRPAAHGGGAIAVIGMAGRFPGARDLREFWRNLEGGVESISFFSHDELAASGVDPQVLNAPNYVRAKGVLDGVEMFAATFFNYSPREAELIDPQQRVFLECAWEAMEHAGYDAETHPGSIGVYAGASLNTYLFNILSDPECTFSADNLETLIASSSDFLTTRVSYKLNLKGPSVNVQTGCSTSLVAVHLACESLLSGQCDLVLAGGVSAGADPKAGYLYHPGGIVSPDGHCRAFDARAQGMVIGSGAGVVVLKRFADALADRDTIHAVIRGTACNNDGSLKAGFTAPSVEGQSRAIAQAQARGGIEPESVGYIEAHGTGTSLGDPIEVSALAAAFRAGTVATGFCALGSVKTNIGHLDAAAGVAGLIKAVLALRQAKIPPSLHFETPNPQIDFARSPFYVNRELVEWKRRGGLRRAGVNSFGVGGTNAHVVLEEAPEVPPSSSSRPFQLLALSAKTPTALGRAAANLAADLKTDGGISAFPDVAYTLQVGRKAFGQRLAVVCRDRAGAASALETGDGVLWSREEPKAGPVVLMFTGQGAQHVNMGRGLYESEPVFRHEIDTCCRLLEPELGLDLRRALYPGETGEAAEAALRRTELTQPALFVIDYALARLWMNWGFEPEAMIGHSIGEYVAACLAGVFGLEDVLKLVATRGRLMQQLPPGAMLSVQASETAIRELLHTEGLDAHLAVAAANGPALSVASGPIADIEKFEAGLNRQEIGFRRLRTSHAFHSRMMDPIVGRFVDEVAKFRLNKPSRRYLSNLTGTWIGEAEATDPGYWGSHLRGTVRFSEGIQTLLKAGSRFFIEAGPGQSLGTLVRGHLAPRGQGQVVASSLPRPESAEPDSSHLLRELGRLWLSGANVNWAGFYRDEKRRRVPLPTYPFERQRYWIERRSRAGIASDPGPSDDNPNPAAPPPEGPARRRGYVSNRHERPEISTPYAAAAGPTEQAIAKVWMELLGLERVGAQDNFFELGGHSLNAIQMAAQLRKELEVEVELNELFAQPTVRGLGRILQGRRRLKYEPIPLAERREHYPVTSAQRRMHALQQLDGGIAYNLPVAYNLEGRVAGARVESAMCALIKRHDALRTRFELKDGEVVQRIDEKVDFKVEFRDEAEMDPEQLMKEFVRPFDLGQAPLLRLMLVKRAEGKYLLCVDVHHIISDLVSIGLLIRDFTLIYDGHELECLRLQYKDYAVWQERRLAGEFGRRQAAYWREKFADGAPVLNLPTDRPRRPRQNFEGRRLRYQLDAELSAAARKFCEGAGVTLYMLLLSVYKILLSKWSGQEDIVVGTSVVGRDHPELEEIMGMFVNAIALRSAPEGGKIFSAYLQEVKAIVLEGLQHQGHPFEELLENVAVTRDPGRNPLFNVLFLINTFGNVKRELKEVKVERREFDFNVSRFDLTVEVDEAENALGFAIEYRTQLFKEETVQQLASYYQQAVRVVVAAPATRLEDIDLVDEKDRRGLSLTVTHST